MRLLAALAALSLITAAMTPGLASAQTISASEVGSLSGSRWTGSMIWNDGSRYETTLYFRADGVLIYGYNGQTYDNGRWTQNERLVTFHTNRYYAVYSGLFDGRGLAGSSYNLTGASGSFSFTQARR